MMFSSSFFFLVDYGETVIGYSKKQMTMLVTILGIGQFFGQLLFGFLANYSFIDELILYNIGAVLCSIASCLIPFVVHSYIALVSTILLFGLAVSANYALTSIILANMCGLELLTSAYGLILLGQGLSSLFGPVFGGKKQEIHIKYSKWQKDHYYDLYFKFLWIGWIAEQYGYKISLIIAGVFMGLSGCVTIILYILQYLNEPEKNTKNERNSTVVASDNLH